MNESYNEWNKAIINGGLKKGTLKGDHWSILDKSSAKETADKIVEAVRIKKWLN